MPDPEIDPSFRKYRFKIKKDIFFTNTDARKWSFYRYYTSIFHSGDSPKTFNEIFDKWTAGLTFIRKHDSTPKPIENFVEKLIDYNKSEEFKSIREACEQNFRAHVLSTLSSGSVTKSEMAQGYKKQANEILSGALEKNDEEIPCTNSFTGEDERNAIIDDIDTTISEFSENDLKISQWHIFNEFGHKSNEDMNGKIPYQPQDERGATSVNILQTNVAESMIGRVERTALIIDDVNLEETFEDYCNECDNIFDLCHSDIMDLRPASKFTEKIPEAIWEKFVTNTYPEYKISETWENLIQDTFKQRESLTEWIEAWRGLHAISDKNESRDPVIPTIKDAIYNILAPYIEAFKAPYNILKSGELGENQYNSQFVSPILNNTLKAILDINWRILEVPVESSKHRRNANINPIIDTVLEAKRADGLARLWQSHEEVFIYEQTGPPDFDDVTQLFIHDYKLVRTMRDVLNQRIILRLRDGISSHKDLASFGAFGHRTEVSLFWCTMHQKSYCLQEYGSFQIPAIWQDLPVLAEAMITCLKFFSFMKENVEKIKLYTDQKNKLFAKRKVHTVKENPPTPNRPKKQRR